MQLSCPGPRWVVGLLVGRWLVVHMSVWLSDHLVNTAVFQFGLHNFHTSSPGCWCSQVKGIMLHFSGDSVGRLAVAAVVAGAVTVGDHSTE